MVRRHRLEYYYGFCIFVILAVTSGFPSEFGQGTGNKESVRNAVYSNKSSGIYKKHSEKGHVRTERQALLRAFVLGDFTQVNDKTKTRQQRHHVHNTGKSTRPKETHRRNRERQSTRMARKDFYKTLYNGQNDITTNNEVHESKHASKYLKSKSKTEDGTKKSAVHSGHSRAFQFGKQLGKSHQYANSINYEDMDVGQDKGDMYYDDAAYNFPRGYPTDYNIEKQPSVNWENYKKKEISVEKNIVSKEKKTKFNKKGSKEKRPKMPAFVPKSVPNNNALDQRGHNEHYKKAINNAEKRVYRNGKNKITGNTDIEHQPSNMRKAYLREDMNGIKEGSKERKIQNQQKTAGKKKSSYLLTNNKSQLKSEEDKIKEAIFSPFLDAGVDKLYPDNSEEGLYYWNPDPGNFVWKGLSTYTGNKNPEMVNSVNNYNNDGMFNNFDGGAEEDTENWNDVYPLKGSDDIKAGIDNDVHSKLNSMGTKNVISTKYFHLGKKNEKQKLKNDVKIAARLNTVPNHVTKSSTGNDKTHFQFRIINRVSSKQRSGDKITSTETRSRMINKVIGGKSPNKGVVFGLNHTGSVNNDLSTPSKKDNRKFVMEYQKLTHDQSTSKHLPNDNVHIYTQKNKSRDETLDRDSAFTLSDTYKELTAQNGIFYYKVDGDDEFKPNEISKRIEGGDVVNDGKDGITNRLVQNDDTVGNSRKGKPTSINIRKSQIVESMKSKGYKEHRMKSKADEDTSKTKDVSQKRRPGTIHRKNDINSKKVDIDKYVSFSRNEKRTLEENNHTSFARNNSNVIRKQTDKGVSKDKDRLSVKHGKITFVKNNLSFHNAPSRNKSATNHTQMTETVTKLKNFVTKKNISNVNNNSEQVSQVLPKESRKRMTDNSRIGSNSGNHVEQALLSLFTKRVDDEVDTITKQLNSSLQSFMKQFSHYINEEEGALQTKLNKVQSLLRTVQKSIENTQARGNTSTDHRNPVSFSEPTPSEKTISTLPLTINQGQKFLFTYDQNRNDGRLGQFAENSVLVPRNKTQTSSAKLPTPTFKKETGKSRNLTPKSLNETTAGDRNTINYGDLNVKRRQSFVREYIDVFLVGKEPQENVKKSFTPVRKNESESSISEFSNNESRIDSELTGKNFLTKSESSRNDILKNSKDPAEFAINSKSNESTISDELSSNKDTNDWNKTGKIGSNWSFNTTRDTAYQNYYVPNLDDYDDSRSVYSNVSAKSYETATDEALYPDKYPEKIEQNPRQKTESESTSLYKGIFGNVDVDIEESCLHAQKGDFANSCPKGWINYKQFCFSVSEETGRWDNVSEACASLDGTIAMPKSQDLLAFLIDELRERKQYSVPYLVGLRKVDEDWVWLDDTPLSHGVGVGQDEEFSSCAVIVEGSLRKQSCDARSGYICEVKLGIQAVRVLALGDSLTKGYHNSGGSYNPYSRKLERLLNKDNHRCFSVETSGKTGEKTDEMLLRLKDSVNKEFDNFDWVVILAGTNDLLNSLTPADTIAENILAMHMVAHAHGARTLVVTIPELHCEMSWCAEAKLRREAVNKKLRAYAEAGGSKVYLSDVSHRLSLHQLTPRQRKVFWEPFGVHMRAAGYDKLAHVIFKDLMEAIESPS